LQARLLYPGLLAKTASHRIALFHGSFGLRDLHSCYHRLASWWPHDGGYCAGTKASGSGFIPDLPVRGNARPEQIVANSIAQQPL